MGFGMDSLLGIDLLSLRKYNIQDNNKDKDKDNIIYYS